ncbi:MAG TPA: alkaline phosphatase family protein, partial [Terriglobales bacterium]
KLGGGAFCLLALITLSNLSAAQIQPGTFKHIIIVVQENRTPDNLFGSEPPAGVCSNDYPFETGVDIVDGGNGTPYQGSNHLICSIPLSITGVYSQSLTADPDHSHDGSPDQPGGWVSDYDKGNMDGFCHEYDNSKWNGICPSYSFVPQTEVQPYFDIATNYGFANYMFQTNEGPSFPAHEFLFAGTSAPVPFDDPSGEWTWFDADNIFNQNSQNSTCTAQGVVAPLINADGSEPDLAYCNTHPNDPRCTKAPCYERAPYTPPTEPSWGSLADLLHANGVGWKYYAPIMNPNGSIQSGLWVAPAAINHFCQASGLNCAGLESSGQYGANMRFETTSEPYPLYDDITDCQLAAVSWAIPDALWSDHAGENNGSGPSYVANIVNAVGNSTCTDSVNGKNVAYWNDTTILIVWDDWGGWYDHINPNAPGAPGVNQTQNTWGAYYTYGFRVPMLVVSAYTGVPNGSGGYNGYVSGACGASPLPTCPNLSAPYIHDFGSILAFIEWNFLGTGAIGTIGKGYQFADNFAPEWQAKSRTVPLLDFFPLTTPRQFVQILVPQGYGPTYFQDYFANNPTQSPSGPDVGEGDE